MKPSLGKVAVAFSSRSTNLRKSRIVGETRNGQGCSRMSTSSGIHGRVSRLHERPPLYVGEAKEKLLQVTWSEDVGFVDELSFIYGTFGLSR